MHSTIIPDDSPHPHLHGQVQEMVFPSNLPPTHKYYEFCGEPKSMYAVLEERGLWDSLCAGNSGKPLVGVYAKCKLSDKACNKYARDEVAMLAGEEDNSDIAPKNEKDNIDPMPWSSTCCMQRVIF